MIPVKDEIKISHLKTYPASSITIKYSLHFVWYLTSSLFLFILAWWLNFKDFNIPPAIKDVAIIILFLALTLVINRAIVFSPWFLKDAWGYRLAFLLSAFLGLCLWIYQVFTLPLSFHFWLLSSTVFGAFLGGLTATALKVGLLEINFTPSQRVKEEVYKYHLELLGEPPNGPWVKRFFDVVLALISLFLFAPIWLLIIFLIWWEDPGPIFFIKNSVGRKGINFRQIKFRTMIPNAEEKTGPILASENDSRMLEIGKFLRKTALDELPQLINILRGDMSFVGPRPQRTILVYEFLRKIPQYGERHKVRPGLAGLAQVMGHYYLTPLQKFRLDRLYIGNISLWLDLKLMFYAVLIVFWLRWRKDWDGYLPRRLRNHR